MILKVKQINRENDHDMVFYNNDGTLYARSKTQSNAFTIASKVLLNDETFTIFGDFSQNIKEQPMKERSEIKSLYTENEYMNANRANFLNDKNDSIGVIKRKRVDTKVLWAEKYIVDYFGEQYTAYYVAKPFKGLFYFVINEKQETVIAIKQNTNSINYYFGYKIYVENDSFAKLAVLFLIYADNHKYGGKWIYSGIHIKGETTLVAQPKEVKEKYDAKFIKKIKEIG